MPQVTSRELLQFLKAHGFIEARQSGSHLTLWNEERRVCITVPVHTGSEIGRGLAVRILKDAGFEVQDFLKWR
jgi:predicted RNA binding protein YcfA (HicA-like mRNA interferase family)